jgi:hypothetical protein
MMIAAHTVISCCSMTREQRQITPSSYKIRSCPLEWFRICG